MNSDFKINGYKFIWTCSAFTMWCLGRTRLQVRPKNTTVNPFDIFTREEVLRCVATSDPSTRPRITWYSVINDTMTQVNTSSSDRLVIDTDGSLIFRGIKKTEWRQFMGWYRCVADNGYTSDSADLFLDVLTSPPVDCTDLPTRREWTSVILFTRYVFSSAGWVSSITDQNLSLCLSVTPPPLALCIQMPLATYVNYTDLNNSVLLMCGHVSAGIFAATTYSGKVNTMVFVILLQVRKLNSRIVCCDEL